MAHCPVYSSATFDGAEEEDADGTLHFQPGAHAQTNANACSQVPSSSPKLNARPVQLRNSLSGTPKDQRRESLIAPPTSTATGPSLQQHLLPDLVAATNNLEVLQQQQLMQLHLRNSSFDQQNGTTDSNVSHKSSSSSGSGNGGGSGHNNSFTNSNATSGGGGNGHLAASVYSPIQRSRTENLNLNLSQPLAHSHAEPSHAAEQLDKSCGASQAAGVPRLSSHSTHAIVQQAVLHGRSPPSSKARDRSGSQINVEVDLSSSTELGDERSDSISPVGGELSPAPADEQLVMQSVDLDGAPDAFAPSNFGGGAGGNQPGDPTSMGGGALQVVPEIRKYKKRFNGEVRVYHTPKSCSHWTFLIINCNSINL